MTGLQQMILIGEISLQSQIAKKAAERLLATHEVFDNVETWCSIQSILVAAGNVSKILWPSQKYKLRGQKLRKLLGVEDNNPLASRKFRNHFEHYDERVEEWFENNSQGVYVDLSMNPSLRSLHFSLPPLNTHRGYNSFNNSVVFRSETLYLDEILSALDILFKACRSY
ncbi:MULTISPECIES: hypothetical protein [Sphingobacterium]|uniref:hypothetical protein n=1 Tax=Sphingobacterium TaxID=28453 RepID=UPI002579BCB7|nr:MULTISPECIES: hypothetical protein [Sphingobacterium]